MSNELLTAEQLAAELGLHQVTLAQWRMVDGKGPAFIKIGSSVRYRRSDVEAWLDKQTRTVTEGSS